MRERTLSGESEIKESREEKLKKVAEIVSSERFLIHNIMWTRNSAVTEEEVDDMVQEISLKLVDSNQELNYEVFLSNQGYRNNIYKNKIIDIYRKSSSLNHVITLLDTKEADKENRFDRLESSSLDVEERLDIQKFFQQLFSEIDEKVKEKAIRPASAEKMKLILERRMHGYTIKEIGNEIGVTEAAVGLITTKLRELFPQYEEVWKIVKAPTHAKDEEEVVLSIGVYEERLKRVLADLDNSSFPLDEKDHLTQAILKWYIEQSLRSQFSLEEYLQSLGYPASHHKIVAIRRYIEKLAGAPINFHIFKRNPI